MTQAFTSEAPKPPASRPVLLWLAEGDETQVKPTVDEAAAFLQSTPEEVTEAIRSGELLRGWFVDWEARPSKP